MSRRETPGHRGLSSEENANMLNGKEWWPNEAELVDPCCGCIDDDEATARW